MGDDGRLTPKLVKFVVGARFLGKDVHDDDAKVHEQPPVSHFALEFRGRRRWRYGLPIQGVAYGTHLHGAGGGAQDEVVGDDRESAKIEKRNVGGAPFCQQIDRAPRELQRGQRAPCSDIIMRDGDYIGPPVTSCVRRYRP